MSPAALSLSRGRARSARAKSPAPDRLNEATTARREALLALRAEAEAVLEALLDDLPEPRIPIAPTVRLSGSAVISITPQDRFGNLLGPFRVSQLAFNVTDAKPVGPIEDHVNGTYSQTIVYDSAASPTVSVSVDGKEIEVVKVTTGST